MFSWRNHEILYKTEYSILRYITGVRSGQGCEACDCDPVGSTGPSCDLYVGQCDCK